MAAAFALAGMLSVTASFSAPADSTPRNRVERGLTILYDFTEGEGQAIHDRSGVGEPLDLRIEDASSVRWSPGSLHIDSSASITSLKPANKLIDAVKKSNAITIEAWLTPANAAQTGPARIVTLSASPNERNFTLGQEKDAFDVRLRTTGTSTNGIPSTTSPGRSLQRRLTHVVYARDPKGSAVIYIDGKQVVQRNVKGNLGNWASGLRLGLANEITKDRPWLGEFHLVAVFDRALTAGEVRQNFEAGVIQKPPLTPEELSARDFTRKVAPLFAKHCLECHDSAIKKGGLDLSRKSAALAGGDSGEVIVPGRAEESLLWESIAAGEMPKDRAPLSENEKAAVQAWLNGGASWPVERIDPAIYLNEGHAGEVWIQRLTVTEYIETVRSAVGVDISQEARELLPRDLRADGFSNTAYNLGVDLKHIEAYGQLAEIIVTRMDVPKFASRFSRNRTLDADKMADFLAAMGKWVLRGPLDEHEINLYRGIATAVISAGGDYDDAVRYILESMLQSPRFIYRIEDHRGSGSRRSLTAYELASRLSYIIWGGPPDADLLRAADEGRLADRKQVEEQVRRMLEDPRAVTRSLQFASEWLDLERLASLSPDSKRFPNWNAELAEDMRRETLAYFEDIVWKQQRPLSDLLNAQVTFATPRLAQHYGLQPAGNELARYDLSNVPGRGGLLTHGSVLTLGGDDASMVTRGLFVLHDLLRGTVNAPPPCVDTTPPPTKTGLTQRGIAEARIANEKCGVCHARFEPLAFGLERFDGIGAHSVKDEHGNALREDGEILFPGEAEPVSYETSGQLMDLLAGSERVRESLTWKVVQFALGRPLLASDAPVIAEIHKTAQQNGGTYSSLITAIALSDLVQKTRTETAQ